MWHDLRAGHSLQATFYNTVIPLCPALSLLLGRPWIITLAILSMGGKKDFNSMLTDRTEKEKKTLCWNSCRARLGGFWRSKPEDNTLNYPETPQPQRKRERSLFVRFVHERHLLEFLSDSSDVCFRLFETNEPCSGSDGNPMPFNFSYWPPKLSFGHCKPDSARWVIILQYAAHCQYRNIILPFFSGLQSNKNHREQNIKANQGMKTCPHKGMHLLCMTKTTNFTSVVK